VTRASYLLHARGRRSSVAAGAVDLLDVRGRRSVVLARGRSKPPIAVSECFWLTMASLILKKQKHFFGKLLIWQL
jgi:hypothetical protein